MIVSYLNNFEIHYFNLHSEEVITSNYLNDDNQGIYISSLQFETLNRVFVFVKKESLDTKKCIVLDFSEIEYVQANILNKLVEIRNLGYKLVFLNVSPEITGPLSLNAVENEKNELTPQKGYNIFYFFSGKGSNIYDLELKPGAFFYKDFKKRLLPYIDSYDKPHASSFVYLKSFVDIKKFISLENPFIYYSLYRLAIKIKTKWKSELNNKPILVGQSLTSTFIVSILSKFLKLDTLVFDKIGPINKIYEKLEKHNFENRRYIVVSDFVCLGTEVKITKNLIEFSGGKYLGNVSLVKVETLTREDLKLDNIDRTISIFSISDKNNQELNYAIYTNLKQLDE